MFKRIKYLFCRFMMECYYELRRKHDSPWVAMKHKIWSVRALNALFDMPD